MKILLIEPAEASRTIGGEDIFLYEPLALEYLAAGVSRDHDVRILDLRLEQDLFQEIVARFERGAGFDGVPGVAFAHLVQTEPTPVNDLDVFPFPDRRFTVRYRPHYFSEWMKPLRLL